MRILILLLLVGIVSCKKKTIAPPENLIPEDKMVEILYDLTLLKGLDATSNTILLENDIQTMPYLYEKYDIDSLQYVRSDTYYASIPQVYQTLYQKVQDRLTQQVDEIEAARKKKNDSIKKRVKRVKDSIAKVSKAKAKPSPAPPDK
ncbi:MAG: DUF4296 domain-containing protein [Bacteroidota bacterium]